MKSNLALLLVAILAALIWAAAQVEARADAFRETEQVGARAGSGPSVLHVHNPTGATKEVTVYPVGLDREKVNVYLLAAGHSLYAPVRSGLAIVLEAGLDSTTLYDASRSEGSGAALILPLRNEGKTSRSVQAFGWPYATDSGKALAVSPGAEMLIPMSGDIAYDLSRDLVLTPLPKGGLPLATLGTQ